MNRKWLFLAGGVLCLLLALSLTAFFGGKFAPDEAPEVDPTEFEVPGEMAGESAVSADKWVIYITGAVMRPGVYEVPAGARVNDALQSAGGFSLHADPEAVNLAAKLEDGVHIRIPEKGEPRKEGGSPTSPGMAPASPISSAGPQPAVYAASPHSEAGKIDINRASALELQSLPNVGPKLSQTIVDYRTAHGPFETAEDLMKVRGIGKKRYEAVKDLVSISR